MGNTDGAWEKWGESDPYFGVLTESKYRKESIGDHREEFFSSGHDFVQSALERYEKNFGPVSRRRALDFGCGVGRLTLALANEFETVVGLDISKSMLLEGQINADHLGRSNVEFSRADDSLSGAPGRFSFVNCYIVLQHIPIVRGMRLIRGLLDKVEPGGGFLIHFSVRTDNIASKVGYWLRHNAPLANAVRNIMLRQPVSVPAMQMNAYSTARIVAELHDRDVKECLLFSDRQGKELLTIGLIGRIPPDRLQEPS